MSADIEVQLDALHDMTTGELVEAAKLEGRGAGSAILAPSP